MTMRSRDTLGLQSIWRLFPWFVAAAMGVVIAVNFGMAWTALHTFPGNAGSDGFDLSNHYNLVLERVAREAALGWSARVEVDNSGHPIVLLSDRAGTNLAGANIAATAGRPVGDLRSTTIGFIEASPGRYVGGVALDEKGQWDLEFTATAGGHEFVSTRRIVVR
jgi:nitrogen fixation protein FixH